jgi:CheY-like chemotaxis protein
MKRLLIVEDQMKDAKKASEMAKSIGIAEVDVCVTVQRALSCLEKGLSGNGPLPDGIVLDLDLGLDSGFELLRYWHRTPELAKTRIIVWSVIEEQRDICDLFKVDSFVSKWEGPDAFRQALERLTTSSHAV